MCYFALLMINLSQRKELSRIEIIYKRLEITDEMKLISFTKRVNSFQFLYIYLSILIT